jgi:hypothetical protein
MKSVSVVVAGAQPNKIVGRERRERISHHNSYGDAFVKLRRRVNSSVRRLLVFNP